MIGALLTVCFWAAGPAKAEPNQVEALAAAEAVAKQGSDASLRNSATSAMRALLELGNQNQPGAVKEGYKAFGDYRTSQNLDIDRMKSRIRQIDLFTNNVSIHSRVPQSLATREVYATTYDRLDPKFLREGEAGRVADEFERKTGMGRVAFLKRLASESNSKISTQDPRLAEKVVARLSSLVEEIPNAKFRQTARSQVESVPAGTQARLIQDGARRIWDVLARYGFAHDQKIEIAQAKPQSSRAPASLPPSGRPQSQAEAKPQTRSDAFKDAGEVFFRKITPAASDLEAISLDGNALGAALQAASEAEDSIFVRVSRRYREIAPQFSGSKFENGNQAKEL